jgi:hypothetical protein
MLSTLFLVMRLTLFVDQCDGNVCSVSVDGSDPILVSTAQLPTCAAEGLLISLDGKCTTPRATPSARTDSGADFSL